MNSPDKKRVLFVCIGNACRSQMAEGFARHYGSDVLIPASAGLSPASRVAPDTIRAMSEKNIDLREHFPKALRQLARVQFDTVVNMSGKPLREDLKAPVKEWEVADPISMDYEQHCKVRDEIEGLVIKLLLDLRRESSRPRPRFRGQGSGRLPV
ncbi:MAG: arsenate reductase ArsC [Bryobacteraceae bacterium]